MQEITIRVRPIVAKFAEEMERRLAQHDATDRHWDKEPIASFANRCAANIHCAAASKFHGDIIATRSAIDAANYAMFIWDRLQEKPSETREG